MTSVTVAERLRQTMQRFRDVAVYADPTPSPLANLSVGMSLSTLKCIDDLEQFSADPHQQQGCSLLIVFDDILPGKRTADIRELLDVSQRQVSCFERLTQSNNTIIHIQSAWLKGDCDAAVPCRVDEYLDRVYNTIAGSQSLAIVSAAGTYCAAVTQWNAERCFDASPGVNQWPGGEVFADIECHWSGQLPALLESGESEDFHIGRLGLLDGYVVSVADESGRSVSRHAYLIGLRVTEVGLGCNPMLASVSAPWSEKLRGSMHLGLGASVDCEMTPLWSHSDILICHSTGIHRNEDGSVQISLL